MHHGHARTVLVTGASIAGPALAYWLARYDFDVTLVERAPTIRTGGYACSPDDGEAAGWEEAPGAVSLGAADGGAAPEGPPAAIGLDEGAPWLVAAGAIGARSTSCPP